MRVRISRQAWNDLLDVKAYTLERYGFAQLEKYESLIEQALETIARNPEAGQQRPVSARATSVDVAAMRGICSSIVSAPMARSRSYVIGDIYFCR